MHEHDFQKLIREMADHGKLVETGWKALRRATMPADAPELMVKALHHAYYTGAQHVFASMMTLLEPGEEPTEKDMARISSIDDELQAFVAELEKKVTKPTDA